MSGSVVRSGLYIGLMSGTSMDGIDAALLSIDDGHCTLRSTATHAYPSELRERVAAVARGQQDDLHTVATLDREVGQEFAHATNALLSSAGIPADEIQALGSHGQTVRHHPPGQGKVAYTVQIGDPATIAENTGITTVADFRRPDVAAGGEGAPLATAFHGTQFGAANSTRVIINIGGISNATLLQGSTVKAGFDCGPGNTLLDGWILEQRGEPYDSDGAWSAENDINTPLFEALIKDPFFERRGPKSTGVEHFNLDWLRRHLRGDERAGEVQATLAELTAFAIERSVTATDPKPAAAYVCGGGARNTDLMRRLNRRFLAHGISLGTTDDIGLASEWVEAAAWAWLAYARLNDLPGNTPVVTGAAGPRVLGAIYPAGGKAHALSD